MMPIMYENDIVSLIQKGKPFECTFEDAGIYIRIDEYVPYVCTAIHAGNKLRDDLNGQCLLSETDRLKEEDPYTETLIDSFPIVIVANNSRYEYDLNRSPSNCVYDEAWGEKIWSKKLNLEQINISIEKHNTYYRILSKLLSYLEDRFGGCLVFDVHSYNWQIRQYENSPVFNLGTHHIDTNRWNSVLNTLEKNLSVIDLPNIESTTLKNTVFKGKGYQASYIKKNFINTLLIPIEVKKVFMEESTGTPYPLVLEKLREGFHLAILETASYFNKKLKKSSLSHTDLLSSDIEPTILVVDRALFKIAKTLETLVYVNPINIQQEKKKFLQQREYIPTFRYKQLRIDPYELKEALYRLPVSEILDPFVRNLYRSVIDAYSTKIEMLTHVGTPQFLYNSLRYYGEPSTQDIQNASFLLHADDSDSVPPEKIYDSTDLLDIFTQAAKEYNLDCKVKLSSNIVAKAMVDNSRKTLFVSRQAKLSQFEVDSLIHHELGVHMVTTLNACQQPLHIFKLGLPGNTYTQEGLAIFSEYLSGNLNLNRLKQLALRVIAVNMMVNGASFSSTFHYLLDEHNISTNAAFTLCLRVFRGGGFTKDYLYLSGFRDIAKLHKKQDITPLLVGKTGLKYLDIISSLIERGWVKEPLHKTPSFQSNIVLNNPILDYLIRSVK